MLFLSLKPGAGHIAFLSHKMGYELFWFGSAGQEILAKIAKRSAPDAQYRSLASDVMIQLFVVSSCLGDVRLVACFGNSSYKLRRACGRGCSAGEDAAKSHVVAVNRAS